MTTTFKTPSVFTRGLRAFRHDFDRSTQVGIILVAVTILVAALSPLLAPFDPVATNADNSLAGASTTHPLGTDQYGRDILSRLLLGGRFALTVAFLATTCAVVLGTIVGTLAAYYGRFIDSAISGIGGCPYANGATGNVASEDVVYMLHGMGLNTGIDLPSLIDTGLWLSLQLQRETSSKVARASRISA